MFDFRYTDQYASFLIRLAWTVEIIAALIGLTISIIVGVSAGLSDQFEESLLGQGASVLVAGWLAVLAGCGCGALQNTPDLCLYRC